MEIKSLTLRIEQEVKYNSMINGEKQLYYDKFMVVDRENVDLKKNLLLANNQIKR